MHRADGSVDFAELDELMDLAAENGLNVDLNIILENSPYWLEERYPEARYMAHDGTIVQLQAASNTPSGGWPGLCIDHEGVRKAAGQFLRAVVERYKDHPALYVYDVWNEPHMEPVWYYPDKLFCYCESSRLKFKAWLQDRYKTLERLNEAWVRQYNSWDQVEPPRVFQGYPDMLDWRTFWLENLAQWLAWKVAQVKALDQNHPVMTHVAHSAYSGLLPTHLWDEWLLTGHVDLFGTSSFPKWLMDNDPVEHLFHLDAVGAASGQKRFWQTELQGGFGQSLGLSRTKIPSAGDSRIWNWHVLITGAKGLMYWQWRPEMLGPESPGFGLCDLRGRPSTPRAQVAAEMAGFISSHPIFDESEPVNPEIGILVSRDIALFNYAAEKTMELYAQALLGAYRAFFDENVPVSLVHTDKLMEVLHEGKLKCLYVPFPIMLREETAGLLKQFVKDGGTLVCEACPGHYKEGGWCSQQIPGDGLDEVFGAEEVQTDRLDTVVMNIENLTLVEPGFNSTILGCLYKEELRTLSPTAKVVGRHVDGTAAALLNSYGKGKACLIGSFPSIAYAKTRDRKTRGLITLGKGLRTIQANVNGSTNVKTRLHRASQSYVLFVVNYDHQDEEVTIDLQGVAFSRAIDLKSMTPAATDGFSISIKVPGQDGKAIQLLE